MSYTIDIRAQTGTPLPWPEKRNAIMGAIRNSRWWHDSLQASGDGEGEEHVTLTELFEGMDSAATEESFLDYYRVLRNTAWEYDGAEVLVSKGFGLDRHLRAVS
jgi:hypothetical protein